YCFQVVAYGIGIDERPNVVLFVKRITNYQLSIGSGKSGLDFLVDVRLDNETTSGRTALTGSAHGTKKRTSNSHIQVSMLCNDDGIVTSQLKQGSSETFSYGLPN